MPKLYLLFVVGYFGLLFGTLFIDLAYGINLAIGIYFVSPWTKWWGALLPEIRWIMILMVANITAWAIRTKRYAKTRIRDARPLQYLIAFNVIMVLVGFICVWPDKHWELVDKQVKVMIFLLLMYKAIDSPKKLEGTIWTFLGGVFYIAWIAYDTGRTGNGRLEGVGTIDSTDSNDIGAIFVTAVPLLFFYALEGRKLWIKGVAFLALAFVMNGLILVNSRGAIIGVAAAMMIFVSAILFTKLKSTAFKAKVIAGCIAGFIVFLYLADATFWDRQGAISTDAESSDYNRLTIWKYALKLSADRPLGVGGMGYTLLSPSFLPAEVMGDSPLKAIHSTYLEALTAYGWAGFLIFVLFIKSAYSAMLKTLRELKKSPDKAYERLQGFALMGSLTGFLVAAVFINRLYCEVLYYFPVFFVIFRNIYGTKKEVVSKAPVFGRPRPREALPAAPGSTGSATAPGSTPALPGAGSEAVPGSASAPQTSQSASRSSTTFRKKRLVLKDRAGGP